MHVHKVCRAVLLRSARPVLLPARFASSARTASILANVQALPNDEVGRLVAALWSRIPRGFGGNVGGEKAEGAEKHEDGKKPDEDKSTEGAGGGGGSGGSGKNKKKAGASGSGPENKIDPIASTLATIALLYAGWVLFGSLRPRGAEISWQEFRNIYLSTGMVDHLEVLNREFVRVYLRNTPNPAFLAAESAAAGGGSGSHGHGVDLSSGGASGADKEAVLADMLATLGPDREGDLRRAVEDARAHKPLYFHIGSVESFERQLEDAQLDMRVRPRDFVLVRHVNEADMSSRLGALLPYILMFAVYAGLFRMMNNAGGGLGGLGGGGGGPGGGGINRMFSIGKARPAVVNKDAKVKVSFKDVAGCDEAKAEIMEFVQFLKDPSKFTALGAKIPKGALLVGPPGTGKTLLAKATAGEASVPFFSMSGSDFIEMFVGVGPSRVRDLFQQARQASPCIIFIDEIDAVARARNKGGFSGGNDERENTLNQLLVEMDGFSSTEGIVVLAGTNRADILDKAILRPGRFDRQITVDKPDIKGRKEIFRVHMKNVKVAGEREAYAQRLAALTPGFVGADIANICNEAAIHAARKSKTLVDLKDFEAAIDRVIGGLERRNALMTPEERRTVAFHEAGHAIAGWFLEHADPLLKVTIIPRGSGALGFAQYLPKEVTLFTREALVDRMCMALGGRASEEVNFGRITTGASDDLDKVTQMAYAMTAVYGMNPRVGNVSFPRKEENQFDKPYSNETARMIDEEVRSLVDASYKRTVELLTVHKETVKRVAELLLERETINQNDLAAIAGPRPWPLNPQLRQYVSSMFEEGGTGGSAGEQAKEKGKAEDEEEKHEDAGGPIPVAAFAPTKS